MKDALGRQAVLINNVAVGADDNMKTAELFAENNALFGRFFIVKLGKRKYHLFSLKRG